MLSLTHLRRAVESFRRAMNLLGQPDRLAGLDPDVVEAVKAGAIQNFEFTYELCWKTIRRWLSENVGRVYVDGVTRRELFRMAAEQRLIEDVERWMTVHRARNETSRLYDEARAEAVLAAARDFLVDAEALLEVLDQR
ncbi:MAG: nucleotidyltransferase [Kiritimatiellaeota bacterium]|nr:nucleotidyltransferase [Kiritimatiellota bacterium]